MSILIKNSLDSVLDFKVIDVYNLLSKFPVSLSARHCNYSVLV